MGARARAQKAVKKMSSQYSDDPGESIFTGLSTEVLGKFEDMIGRPGTWLNCEVYVYAR